MGAVSRELRIQNVLWTKPETWTIRIKTSTLETNRLSNGASGIATIDKHAYTTHAWAMTRKGSFSLVVAELEIVRCALIQTQQQG